MCGAAFTCIDCNVTFHSPSEWKTHTSCISEDQKYQKSLYKGPKVKTQQPQSQANESPVVADKVLPIDDTTVTGDTSQDSSKKDKKKKDKKDKKRKHEDENESDKINNTTVEPVVDVSEQQQQLEEEPVKKKTKKEKKNKDKNESKDESAVDDDDQDKALTVQVANPSNKSKSITSESKSQTTTTKVTLNDEDKRRNKIQAWLGQQWPLQLKDSKPLIQHQQEIKTKAFNDKIVSNEIEFENQVWNLFLKGCHVGGKKPKRMLSLKFSSGKDKKQQEQD
ncbi:hypothetical protein OIO90_006209 [Microbotryomycetes sp. JL221]|nr:hypothetical protein OIO90_006209 [Microbotryomycetes sp. JL221]